MITRIRGEIRRNLKAASEVWNAHPQPILVYQMAKVGSTSIVKAISAANQTALHVHFLEDLHKPAFVDSVTHEGKPSFHFLVERILRLEMRLHRPKFRIITLVRDPVARAVSSVYEIPERCGVDSNDSSQVLAFLDKTMEKSLEYCHQWFDLDFFKTTGVNPLKEEFNKTAGFSRFSNEDNEIIVIKLEKLDQLWGELSRFLGFEIKPVRSNTGEQKASAESYRTVKEKFRLPRERLEELYSCQFVQHFYDSNEINQFIEKWSE